MTNRTLFLIGLFCVALVALSDVQDAHAGTTKATAYGPGLYGNTMACGGRLGVNTIAVAAMPGMPCGQRVTICHRGVCARLRVRDRCPSCNTWKRFDLSAGAVRRIWGVSSCAAWGVRTVWWKRG